VRLPRPTRAAVAVVAVPVALAFAACGRGEEPDLVNGKTLFVQKCGSCHVLKRANTQGVQGPSLDEAFDAARREGMTERTVEGVTRRQIANVRRSSIMPPNLVTGDDARDVASYVGEAAGVPGQDQGPLAQAGKPKTSNKPIKASRGQLKIDADPTGALAFVSTRAIAPPGQITLLMGNKSSVQHNIAVKNGSDEKGPVVGQGGTSRLSTSLKKGKYTFYCSVPGHEAGGMKGDLTVE
jgi:mono/diheme cytochrome c family protein